MKNRFAILAILALFTALVGCAPTDSKAGQSTVEGDYVSEPGGGGGKPPAAGGTEKAEGE
jgi:hypothetical protein